MSKKEPLLKITLIKSRFGRIKDHRETIKGLGLKKIGQSVVRQDNDCIRGMVNKVNYLVQVEEC